MSGGVDLVMYYRRPRNKIQLQLSAILLQAANVLTQNLSSADRAPSTISMSSRAGTKTQMRKCPVTHHTTDQEDFEHDFTTQGRIGNLDCPFGKLGLPDTPESQDPIAAEFHQDQVSVNASTSASGALGRCPIRFLDKHSPAEVAEYFSKHKHELPRSHQVCVQRYSNNLAGAKQLDAKYGSMVNMIQGLGVKHKQYLPEDERPVKQQASTSSAVEKWAEGVSEPPSAKVEGDEARQSHFERPLREVRVGESPSRPWGISVPASKDVPASAMESEARPNPVQSPSVPALPNGAPPASAAQRHSSPEDKVADHIQPSTAVPLAAPPTQIFNGPVFQGPVFLGYSVEDAGAFLKMLNNPQSNTEPR